MSPRALVLLQTSDVLAGAPLVSPGVGWTPELREALREERADVLARAVDAARDAGADAIVVPGNLWEAETVSVPKLQRLLDALASFAPNPVLVAPGPRDASARLPFGEPSFRAALGLSSWPENVHVFASGAWSARGAPGRDDVLFVGRAYDGMPLPEPPSESAPLRVLVAGAAEKNVRVPEGWSWGAFGGRPAAEEIRDGERLRGAFAGAPVPSAFDLPEPAFLLVRLAVDEEPSVTRIPSSRLRFVAIRVDVTGLEEGAILETAARRIEEAGAGASDAVRVTLEGTPALSARLSLAPLGERVRHLSVRDRTSRPSPGETAGSAEERFAGEMNARVAAADADGARASRLALEMGRAALAGRPLAPPPREDA